MKWVVCVVVGGGSLLSVDINEAKTIGELKKLIKEKDPAIIRCSAEALTLYVAKKGNHWLEVKDYDLEQLKRGELPEGIQDVMKEKEMDPDSSVGSSEFGFPDANDTEDGAFHVVVDARIATPAAVSEEATTTEPNEVLGTKRKRYAHAEMNKEMAHRVLQDLHIEMKLSPSIAATAEEQAPIDEFEWECASEQSGQTVTETQQRERYHAYLEQHLGNVLEKTDLCVFGVEEQEDVLNVGLPGYNLNLAGRTDVLILNSIVKEEPDALAYMQDVRMLVEVERAIEENSVFQAMSELIALDLLSNDLVMALLTNLTDVWHFFWVSDRINGNQVTIEHAVVSKPGAAFEIIRSLLSQPSDTDVAEISLPCFQEPVKRRKLDAMLPYIRSDNLSILKEYYDTASVSGPDIELARATGNRIVQNMPAFRKYA